MAHISNDASTRSHWHNPKVSAVIGRNKVLCETEAHHLTGGGALVELMDILHEMIRILKITLTVMRKHLHKGMNIIPSQRHRLPKSR